MRSAERAQPPITDCRTGCVRWLFVARSVSTCVPGVCEICVLCTQSLCENTKTRFRDPRSGIPHHGMCPLSHDARCPATPGMSRAAAGMPRGHVGMSHARMPQSPLGHPPPSCTSHTHWYIHDLWMSGMSPTRYDPASGGTSQHPGVSFSKGFGYR